MGLGCFEFRQDHDAVMTANSSVPWSSVRMREGVAQPLFNFPSFSFPNPDDRAATAAAGAMRSRENVKRRRGGPAVDPR
jgi:hypothetical protein